MELRREKIGGIKEGMNRRNSGGREYEGIKEDRNKRKRGG